MFGPNTIVNIHSKIDFCHRDKEFFTLHKKLVDIFKKKKFDLNNYEIIFIPGSGTIGIEAMMFSLNSNIKVVGNKGKFTSRWEKMAQLYNYKTIKRYEELFCQLETSTSLSFYKEDCIVDAISSFPFYDIPKGTKAFITSSNKILGSLPGVAIVCIKKTFLKHFFQNGKFSYLNISRYLKYSKSNQTPSTPPVQILDHLYQTIKNFKIDKIRDKIINNSSKIVNHFGNKNIIGEYPCPVISIPKSLVPNHVAQEYQLYHIHSESDYYQIFTYSEHEQLYDSFLSSI